MKLAPGLLILYLNERYIIGFCKVRSFQPSNFQEIYQQTFIISGV